MTAGRWTWSLPTPARSTVGDAAKLRETLQRAMTAGAGVLRDAASLATGRATRWTASRPAITVEAAEVRNLSTVGAALVTAAAAREESRGAHTRTDFPDRSPELERRIVARVVHRVSVHPPVAAVREAVAAGPRRGPQAARRPHRRPAPCPRAWAMSSLVPRQAGVLAGRLCADEAFAQVDPALMVTWLADDGDRVTAGEVIGAVSGPLASILTAERTALNFLGHLSGVATLTRRFVEAAAGGRAGIRDTRKTTPGLRALEKAAVRAGGGAQPPRQPVATGCCSRTTTSPAVGIADAVAPARRLWPGAHASRSSATRSSRSTRRSTPAPTLVLLDNMTPDEVAGVRRLRAIAGAVAWSRCPAASPSRPSRAYADAGADLISVGAITHSAPVLDIGLDMRPDGRADVLLAIDVGNTQTVIGLYERRRRAARPLAHRHQRRAHVATSCALLVQRVPRLPRLHASTRTSTASRRARRRARASPPRCAR